MLHRTSLGTKISRKTTESPPSGPARNAVLAHRTEAHKYTVHALAGSRGALERAPGQKDGDPALWETIWERLEHENKPCSPAHESHDHNPSPFGTPFGNIKCHGSKTDESTAWWCERKGQGYHKGLTLKRHDRPVRSHCRLFSGGGGGLFPYGSCCAMRRSARAETSHADESVISRLPANSTALRIAHITVLQSVELQPMRSTHRMSYGMLYGRLYPVLCPIHIHPGVRRCSGFWHELLHIACPLMVGT